MNLDRFKRVLTRFFVAVLATVSPFSVQAAGVSMQLDNVRLGDLVRVVYGDVLKSPYILDSELLFSTDSVSVSWNSVGNKKLDSLTRELLQRKGFETETFQGVMIVRKSGDVDEGSMIYIPRYRSTKYLSDIVRQVSNVQQLGSRGISSSPEFQQAASKSGSDAGSALGMVDRSALDQMAYRCKPAKCVQLRLMLTDLDTPEPQVVLRAVLYEVGKSKGQGSAVQLAASILKGRATFKAGALLAGADTFSISTGLDFVISLLDQDSHFKVISRPMLRVKTGAQARFSVGQQVPVLGAITQDKNGNAQQSVEYRQSGTIFTVQPDIRADIVDLSISQELSSFVETTTGVNNSPTLFQRTASSQLSIRPGEVVVFAGLEEGRSDEASTGLFGFTTSKKNSTSDSEVLLLIEAERI